MSTLNDGLQVRELLQNPTAALSVSASSTLGGVLTAGASGTFSFKAPIGFQPLMDGYGNFVFVTLPGGFIDIVVVEGYGL